MKTIRTRLPRIAPGFPGLLLICVIACLWFTPAAGGEVWVEDTFEDFADGQLDASGQNLYVSRDGRIRTIHRFDLNDDGYIDLIFNSTHDTKTAVPATLGTIAPDGGLQSTLLPVDGSVQVLLSDLNRDGWLDAVFCPNDSGLQHPRRFLTILWGSDDGWSARRSGTLLPTHDASALAVADLNHDQWPDLIVLNGSAWLVGQEPGRVLRIYWGGSDGYLLTRRREISVPEETIELASADWDGNGTEDLAVLTRDGQVHFFWEISSGDATTQRSLLTLPGGETTCLTAGDLDGDGKADLIVGTQRGVLHLATPRTRDDWSVREVQAYPASHVAMGDLDGDGHADLVLCRFGMARAAGGEAAGAEHVEKAVRILWGRSGRFEKTEISELPIMYAAATAIGDMNGDQWPDLLVAVHQSEVSFATDSAVFRGRGERRFERVARGFATQGAVDVAYAPPDGQHPARAVFANSLDGTVGEHVPLLVYWGGAGGFHPQNVLRIPFRSGDEATSADFDADGYVDLLAINSQHAGAAAREDPHGGANIFWGAATGFDFEKRRTVLRETLLGTSNTADLNKDGYLDLVLGIFDPSEPDGPTPVVIYYGSADGYSAAHRVELACEGRSIGTLLADFDRNGWLDIAVSSTYLDRLRIFWNGPGGFDPDRQTQLRIPYPIDLEAADLNADGYLDLIAGSYYDPIEHHHDMGTMIFWGSPGGFRQWDAQRLPGWSPVGHCVADFDADGYLDLFAPHYLGEITREQIPSYLFWGGPDGFAADRRTNLICDSAHDALAADFDGDGRIDLTVSCHTRNGDHRTTSKVFYNDGKRFAAPRVVELPTTGTHWMWGQDMGHIAHRRWEQVYESSIHELTTPARGGTLDFVADQPPGSRLTFFIRSAPQASQITARDWRPVEQARFSLHADDRAVQYRVVFHSPNGDRFATLDRVELRFAGADLGE